ncbi:hypothetical protein [Streptomyces sp. 891-h]|uniref:hypothetical protein n=1 Tax=Streptomyces sp. 891-h TaxID=2720714 RepID=UPI001FA955A1|nr:hypothetical protein [Streptomyces sp. 891-h]UNZ22322.1 hypothetical protein HC362_34720 [Streptomyces sp. 891-h]
MGVKNQAAILWAGLTGKRPPRSVGEIVSAVGGTARAARLAGVAQRTVQKWRKEERDATSSVRGMVRTVGGRQQAAAAAGVSERTIRDWERQERRGRTPGPRQQARMDRLRQAAATAHTRKISDRSGVGRMQEAVLDDAQARQQAISPRRAARIARSGGRVQMHADVSVISTDPLDPDRRDRKNIDVELRGPVMDETMSEWMSGGDSNSVLGKMSDAFTKHYLHSEANARAAAGEAGARWEFHAVRGMKISQATPGETHVFEFRQE